MCEKKWKIVLVVMVLAIGGILIFVARGAAADFPTALAAASATLPYGADVHAMGGVATVEEFSSSNPAITSIMREGRAGGTLNYGYFQFERTRLQTVSGSAAVRIGEATAFQFAYGHAESPNSWLDETQSFKLISDSYDFQLGTRVAKKMLFSDDELYIGIGYTFSDDLQKGTLLTPTEATTFVTDVKTTSQSHSGTLGIAYKPIKQITIGAYGTRSWTRSETTYNGTDLEIGYAFQDVYRVGFSANLIKGWTTIAGDYQHISFSDSDVKFDQFFVGVEQYLIKEHLAIYGGLSNGAPTAGLGIYFPNGGLNVSYGHQMQRELKPYLGSCDAVMASVYFNF